MKVGIIHATMNAVQPMVQAFSELEPQVSVLNFVNEGLLSRANQVGKVDEKGLREFAKLVFQAVDAGVDGIIVACSVYCPFVPIIKNFVEIPMIAVDRSMILQAVECGNKIGIIATTAPSAPSAKRQIEKMANDKGKKISTEIEIVTEGMAELKKGNIEKHNQIVRMAAERLIQKNCDVIVLSQITMACAAGDMKDLNAKILTSPSEGVKSIMKLINAK